MWNSDINRPNYVLPRYLTLHPYDVLERRAKGNKAHYADAKLIKSKFLKKNTKMKIYRTMIRPVVTYSSETWTLTAKDGNNLRIFERQNIKENIWSCQY